MWYNILMKDKKGFTVIELMVVGVFAALLLIIFFIQKSNVDAMNRDDDRKTAINAMYYALEEYFYPKNGYYPAEINEEILPVIDPALFTDPLGMNLGVDGSSYSYEVANCNSNNECREFTLRAALEKEDAYIKKGKK